MAERFQIFKQTEEKIGKRLGYIESLLQTNTEELGGLDMDGDMTDDPILHQLKGGREKLLEEKNKLLGYLRTSSGYVGQGNIDDSDGIKKGHMVCIQIEYSDKYKEDIEITIGSKLDSDFLGDLGV